MCPESSAITALDLLVMPSGWPIDRQLAILVRVTGVGLGLQPIELNPFGATAGPRILDQRRLEHEPRGSCGSVRSWRRDRRTGPAAVHSAHRPPGALHLSI